MTHLNLLIVVAWREKARGLCHDHFSHEISPPCPSIACKSEVVALSRRRAALYIRACVCVSCGAHQPRGEAVEKMLREREFDGAAPYVRRSELAAAPEASAKNQRRSPEDRISVLTV